MLQYKNNILHIENVRVDDLAKKYGTPLYIYSARGIANEYRTLSRAIRGIPSRIHYAVKANTNPALLRILKKEGCSFDVDSLGELLAAEKAGARGRDIIYTGPGKTEEELQYAIEKGVLFIGVESTQEAERIAHICSRIGKKARLSIRLNPDMTFRTHAYIATGGKEHKFGMDEKGALAAYDIIRRSPHLSLVGINAHIGCQLESGAMRARLAKKLIALADTLNEVGAKIQYIDTGGGLPFDYHHKKKFDAQKYFAPVKKVFSDTPYTFIIEPGRRIVAGHGHLISSVLYTKQHHGNHFTIVDAAMNDLIRPSLYDAHHEMWPATKTKNKKIATTIAGPICESGDFFAKNGTLPELRPGDIFAILDAGAYGFAMVSNYNMRRKPAEVLVDGKKHRLIRKRQTYKGMF